MDCLVKHARVRRVHQLHQLDHSVELLAEQVTPVVNKIALTLDEAFCHGVAFRLFDLLGFGLSGHAQLASADELDGGIEVLVEDIRVLRHLEVRLECTVDRLEMCALSLGPLADLRLDCVLVLKRQARGGCPAPRAS